MTGGVLTYQLLRRPRSSGVGRPSGAPVSSPAIYRRDVRHDAATVRLLAVLPSSHPHSATEFPVSQCYRVPSLTVLPNSHPHSATEFPSSQCYRVPQPHSATEFPASQCYRVPLLPSFQPHIATEFPVSQCYPAPQSHSANRLPSPTVLSHGKGIREACTLQV